MKRLGDILLRMLTKEDKNWIVEKLETELEKKLRKELKPVRDSVDLLRGKITEKRLDQFTTESRLNSIEASVMRTEEDVHKILNIVDGFAGKVAELDQENKMGSITLRRHDIQIHELATATGTTISE